MDNGTTIRKLREAAGISQVALSRAMGWVDAVRLCRYETGILPLPPEVYHQIALKIHELKAKRDAAFQAAAEEA